MARRPFGSILRMVLPLFGATYYFFVRPQMLRAGTRPGEADRDLAGDDLIASPNFQVTRGIDIDAPPDAVWPWIEQIGRDGTGFYGDDRITNRGIPSAAYLRQDLPVLQAGSALDSGARVLKVEPNRLLLVGGFDLPSPLGLTTERTTLFLLEPRNQRPINGTRLLIRTRGYTYGMFGPLYNLIAEVADYLNGMAQLDNIRRRAETLNQLQKPVKVSSAM